MANPGYAGPWPRVAIWYGTADTTVVPANATELRDQWTNVQGVAQTPTGTSSLPGGTTAEAYGPGVSLYRVQGIGHGTPVAPGSAENQCGSTGTYYLASICSSYYLAQFWGLGGGVVVPTTSPTVPPSPVCFTANNYAQTVAGRAHQSLGYVYADGSNQAVGLWNTTGSSLRHDRLTS